jgi:endonuclease YncB( thermonuclease family)
MNPTTFYALRGSFYVASYSPDGDSIRFRPDHPTHLRALAGSDRLTTSAKKQWHVQVRLEGVDAPELHYLESEQRRAREARAQLLARLGFNAVTYHGAYVLRSSPGYVRGWLLTRSVDITGRVIGLAYRPDQVALAADYTLEVSPDLIAESVNAEMIGRGAAYSLMYASLAKPLRDRLVQVAKRARTKRAGVWRYDTTAGFELRGLGSIGTRGALVFPKLFRRAVSYCWDVAGGFVASAFRDWLCDARASDDGVIYRDAVGRFSDFVRSDGKSVSLRADVLDMVFLPR